MKIDASTIATITSGELLRDGPAGPVQTDSRAFEAGSWFLALHGDRFDGHDFLPQIAEKSPAGAIVSRPPPSGWTAGAVQVPNTVRALQDLGRWARGRLRCPVVGLTGSSGKTTTRALCALAVGQLGKVHQTPGNLNNHLGVPMTLLAAPDDAGAAVIEMGTSGPGEIAILADIARPTVRLIVNVGPAHLQELGGLEGVAREKGCLFLLAGPGDTLCVNVDDPRVAAVHRPKGTRVVTYGEAADAEIRLLSADIVAESLSTRATWRTPAGDVTALIPVAGRHVAHDAAGALAVAWSLGLDVREAAASFERYEPVGMRMRREPLADGLIAINDAYNANPSSMEASLRVLAELPGRRAAVLGDMLELGTDELAWHAKVAELAASLGLDLVVLTGQRMASAGGRVAGERVWVEPEPSAVAAKLRSWLKTGDTVLFKGSRGARVERILQALRGDGGEGAGGHGGGAH